MPHDLKALALAAMEATAKADYFRQERVFNDDRAYWFMIEHDAWEAYRKAATPQRILQYRNEVLEEAAKICEAKLNNIEADDPYRQKERQHCDELDTADAYLKNAAAAIRALKTKEPT